MQNHPAKPAGHAFVFWLGRNLEKGRRDAAFLPYFFSMMVLILAAASFNAASALASPVSAF